MTGQRGMVAMSWQAPLGHQRLDRSGAGLGQALLARAEGRRGWHGLCSPIPAPQAGFGDLRGGGDAAVLLGTTVCHGPKQVEAGGWQGRGEAEPPACGGEGTGGPGSSLPVTAGRLLRSQQHVVAGWEPTGTYRGRSAAWVAGEAFPQPGVGARCPGTERSLHPWMENSRGLPKLAQKRQPGGLLRGHATPGACPRSAQMPAVALPRAPSPGSGTGVPLGTCFSSITVDQLTWGSMCCRQKL